MSPKILIISFVVIGIILVGGVWLISGGQKPTPTTASYTAQETDRPKAESTPGVWDLGEMKVSDVGKKDFTLKNSGTKPLQILNVSSSCGCTTGQIIYKGQTSREYGMHSQSGYFSEVAPGDEAIVRVIYRPAIMPVYGAVEREVYVTTNDPVNSKVVFAVKANVK